MKAVRQHLFCAVFALLSLPASGANSGTSPALPGRHPAWAPDGQWLAFHDGFGQETDLFLARADGSNVRQLTKRPGRDEQPAWSPDGARLIFVSDRGGKPALHIFTVATGEIAALGLTPEPDGEPMHPAWGADHGLGERLAFAVRTGAIFRLWLANPDGSGAFAVAPDVQRRAVWPRWHPRGEGLAYFSRDDTDGRDDEIYRWNVLQSGASPLRLTTRAGHDFGPAWSPDGTRLVFTHSDPARGQTLMVIDTAGREIAEMGRGNFRVVEPAWSPDGRVIACAVRGTDRTPSMIVFFPAPDPTAAIRP